MNPNSNEEDEPQPEQLNNNIFPSSSNPSPSHPQPLLSSSTNKSSKHLNYSRDNISINNNNNNKANSLNVSKALTTANPENSIYKNFDIQNLTYSLMKDYSQLRISKEESFMERMKFDIYKRQIKEERINKLIEQNKMKIDEEDRIKAFNRLIEDANRRIEAQDNLEAMKHKIEEDLITKPVKKYKEEEWKDIYNERFKKFQEDITHKNEERIKQKREEERIKEDKEVELCKVKKAPKNVIEKSSKRLYEESIKRRLKAEAKLSKVNYDNSPSKYKKGNQFDYNFISDNEDDNNNNKQHYGYNQPQGHKGGGVVVPKIQSKNKKTSVTEFNNKRFDVGNNINKQRPISNSSNNNNKYNVSNNQKTFLTKEQHNYLNKHLDEDEEEERQVPQPTTSTNNDWGLKNYNNTNLEIAAINRLANPVIGQNNNNTNNNNSNINNSNLNYVNIDFKQQFPHNILSMNESEASKIVDHFFTQNLNKQ